MKRTSKNRSLYAFGSLARVIAGMVVVAAAFGFATQSAASICDDPVLVTLDIGHSPSQAGASSARGKTEYAFNRRLVREFADALRTKGRFQVSIMNEAGENISLASRAALVQAIDRGVFLSIHHDSVQPVYLRNWVFHGKLHRFTTRARGYSLFISAAAASFGKSELFAKVLGRHLVGAGFNPSDHHSEPIQGENRPVVDIATGVFRIDGLAVLKLARVPALLVEVGVITHPREELDLETPRYREAFIDALIAGIDAYCAGSHRHCDTRRRAQVGCAQARSAPIE